MAGVLRVVMFPAFLSTICFSLSAVTGNRCARVFGGVEANLYRLTIAAFLLGLYVHMFGQVITGSIASAFVFSGIVGVGFGDVLFFQALPRLGSRLTVLLIQCLSVPFAAAVEWLWLGTTLRAIQVVWIIVILGGLTLALLSGSSLNVRKSDVWPGIIYGVLAAFGNGFGAVLSRKAYALAAAARHNIDGFSAAYQRVLGGLAVAVLILLMARWKQIHQQITSSGFAASHGYCAKWRMAWPWVIGTSLAGQTLGVTCFLWALKTHPTAVVLPVVALTPLVAIPFTRIFEGEKPTLRSLIGAAVAVMGVILLLDSQ